MPMILTQVYLDKEMCERVKLAVEACVRADGNKKIKKSAWLRRAIDRELEYEGFPKKEE